MEFQFFAEPPEEIKRQMEEEADHMAASYEAARLEIERLFGDLTPDQLMVLKRLINSIVANHLAGPYWEGVITTYLNLKHHLCPGCTLNHDHEAEALLKPASQPQVEGEQAEGQLTLPYPPQVTVKEYQELCRKYNVAPDPGLDPSPMNPVSCMGCGLAYINLADRMIKPPGIAGCHGCQAKSAWG